MQGSSLDLLLQVILRGFPHPLFPPLRRDYSVQRSARDDAMGSTIQYTGEWISFPLWRHRSSAS